ncbi:MAG TPA: succinylglutamate desuccinylase/aspartoacylase family protein [Candidatus Limnocylindria bacterium]|nr:succinylglutamate desuccinylase/aspartoacylase family protein [Candidatus Limnocylindria bacterium]
MFLDVPVTPGQVIRQRVSIGELSDGSPIGIPVVTIGGAKPGPTLYLQAGIHGDEQTGIAICRGAIAAMDPSDISGTVVAVPVANLPSFLTRTRGFLHEERWLIDINRIFPGNPHGLLTERIADALLNQFARHADLTIDLHSALDGCDIAPFVYIDPDDDEGGTLEAREKYGLAYGTPYAYYKNRHARLGTSDLSRSFSAKAEDAGILTISAEVGESRRVSWERVPDGVRGVSNVMRAMGMLAGEPEDRGPARRFSKITLVHAEHGGGLHLDVDLGDDVTAGQEIGEIVDVFGDRVERIEASADGFILRAMRLGSVSTGAEIVWIAS